ncbi:cardioacceleratory peptide receptor-like [Anopheles ziemanni]|uniref:cardioacceleratory peptide receptor-like n=1 Tax=Anopheles coustani TaxID=139045 RepID=UPI0026593A64|nr:cardioacceleratory peptide receptor-like [Anopheles coustani]XP_058168999.1 cardioacceleratory peptide receptor-like [Anopheles ziemanni]
MLPILTWAYLRHLAVQYHADPAGPAFGSVQPREPATPYRFAVENFPGSHGFHCDPIPMPHGGSLPAAGTISNASDEGRGFGPDLDRRPGDLRFRPPNCGSKLDIRFGLGNDSGAGILPPSASVELGGSAFTSSMRFREQEGDTFGVSRHVPVAVAAAATGSPSPLTTVQPGLVSSVGSFVAVNDAIGMNITPALSQVLLAPPATSGSGASIIAAANGAADDNGTRGEEINSFYFYETEQFAVMWVLFTVIVLGNSAVLVTLMLNRTRKSRMNFFIKQLAIADLCVGLLSVLTDIIWRITVVWRAGNAACKAIRFVQACVTYASTYVLVALSIDRYDAITHPMNFSGCWSRARRLVAAAWSFSILFSLPITYFYEERLIQGKMQCWIDLVEAWRWQLYMCWVSGSLFVVPALIISACYAIIVRTIWAKGTILGPIDRTHNGMADLASRRASSRGIIPRAKVKTVKMTIVIVIVFVVCWSPYIIFDLLQVFGKIPPTQTNVAIATFIQSLAPLNSAANPLIYCLFSTQVCRMIKRLPPFRWLWSTKWCCRPHDSGNLPLGNGTTANGTAHGRFHNHNSSDSMRTLTTSLTVSRRSCLRPPRVVIVERPKTELAMSEV